MELMFVPQQRSTRMAEPNSKCGCEDCCGSCCGCCCKLITWCWNNFWSINFLVLGTVGATLSMVLLTDEDWKVPVSSYFAAVAASAMVTFIVRKGNLYYRNAESDIKGYFQACRTPLEDPQLNPPNHARDDQSNPAENSFDNLREPPSVSEGNSNAQPDNQPNITVAEVHQSSEDSERIPLESSSPEEMESSSSNPIGSDPQASMSALDSGVTIETSAASSGGEQQIPPELDHTIATRL